MNNISTNVNEKGNEIEGLKRNIILVKMQNSIEILFKIINKNLLLIKFKAFANIKNFFIGRKINFAKAEIIYLNFHNKMINLIKIKENCTNKRLFKYFNFWRLVNKIYGKIQEIKDEIKITVTNKYRSKIEESEKSKVQKETENAKIKKEITKNQELDSGLFMKIKDFEDNEILILQNIQKLENEKKLIEEEILIFSSERDIVKKENSKNNKNNFVSCKSPERSFSNNEAGNGSKCGSSNKSLKGKKEILIGLEKKINEYEKKINKLTEVNNNKDLQINLFMKEMNEMIGKHERTRKILTKEKINSFSRITIINLN